MSTRERCVRRVSTSLSELSGTGFIVPSLTGTGLLSASELCAGEGFWNSLLGEMGGVCVELRRCVEGALSDGARLPLMVRSSGCLVLSKSGMITALETVQCGIRRD